MKGEVAQVKEENPKKPAAKSMMGALRETVGALNRRRETIMSEPENHFRLDSALMYRHLPRYSKRFK
jgi:hypothetical protein